MSKSIRSATSSMTSVPKPLKFLRPHYLMFRELYETWPESDEKKTLVLIIKRTVQLRVYPIKCDFFSTLIVFDKIKLHGYFKLNFVRNIVELIKIIKKYG